MQCRQYARIQNIVTDNRTSVRKAFALCQAKTKAHWLNTPMSCAELGAKMCLVRACESGKRDSNGNGIPGTFNYRADNDGPSDASGGYGYLDSSWGFTEGFARALLAPPRIQDQRAMRDHAKVLNGAADPWDASKDCWQ